MQWFLGNTRKCERIGTHGAYRTWTLACRAKPGSAGTHAKAPAKACSSNLQHAGHKRVEQERRKEPGAARRKSPQPPCVQPSPHHRRQSAPRCPAPPCPARPSPRPLSLACPPSIRPLNFIRGQGRRQAFVGANCARSALWRQHWARASQLTTMTPQGWQRHLSRNGHLIDYIKGLANA